MNENMKKRFKVAAVTAIALLTLSVVVFVYANSSNNYKTNSDEQQKDTMRGYFISNDTNIPPGLLKRLGQMSCNGPRWLGRFLENATLSTVNGTVSSQLRGMLILNTDSGQVRVLLPKDWTGKNEEKTT